MSCTGATGERLVSLAPRTRLEPPARPRAGMRWRLAEFGTAIQFFAPGLKRWQTREWRPEKAHRFLPVSITGTACALQCDHCQTKVLEGMVNLVDNDLFATARALARRGTEGILVSGGSTRDGEVPLQPHLAAMRRVRAELGLRVIVHAGVVTPELADGLARAGVEGVMLDVIGADETVREVYHLDRKAADFERSLERLTAAGLTVLPHIVIGLHYGRLLGEWAALDMISRHRVSTLILVVLTPLVGTPMAGCEPPRLDEVEEFIALAREKMPSTPLNLGCGRPLGAMKVALDKAAIDHGVNGIAYPAEGIIEYAKACGLEPQRHEACCSMTWAV